MKDEIKEILDFKEDADFKRLSVDEITDLKNYITNLQERNNNLKEDFKRHIDRINELTERNEKARNYIMLNYYEDLYDDSLTAFEDKLLNILQGSDK